MKTLGELRRLTASLPDGTPLVVPAFDHSYRHPGCEIAHAIYHICASPAQFEPDYGNNPQLYGYWTEEQVEKARHTVVVIK